MFSLSNVATLIQIFAAEMLFLYSFPKRKRFVMRYTLCIMVCLAAVVFVPDTVQASSVTISIYKFVRYVGLFALSVVAMSLCFDVKFFPLLAACSAGYAVQHASSRLLLAVGTLANLWKLNSWGDYGVILSEFLFFPFTYTAAYFAFGKIVTKSKFYENSSKLQNVLSIVMVIICVGLSRFPSTWGRYLYAVFMCLFALLVQITLQRSHKLREENAVVKSILRQERKHYQMSKENIDFINIKCHDLKYRLASCGGKLPQQEMEEILRAINFYDTDFKTGNEVLDTVLSEKILKCDGLGIRLSCMADGKALDFMEAGDLYSLFGNALDNAIEAVSRLDDSEKRTVSVTVESRGEIAFINIMNYYDGELQIVQGTPQTTKTKNSGFHGFGFKSMKAIAEKYHGSINVAADNDTFTLCAYLTKV